MVTNALGMILQEIGNANLFSIDSLIPDRNNTCKLNLPGGLKFQMELDKTENYLIVISDLGEIPAGKYRSNLFREALRSNSAPYPRYGYFAFSTKTQHLILTDMLKLSEYDGTKITEFLKPFMTKAKTWLDAIQIQELPADVPTDAPSLGSFFGIK